jgi:hypothetical protein
MNLLRAVRDVWMRRREAGRVARALRRDDVRFKAFAEAVARSARVRVQYVSETGAPAEAAGIAYHLDRRWLHLSLDGDAWGLKASVPRDRVTAVVFCIL